MVRRTAVKRSITLDPRVDAAIQEVAGKNYSAFINEAAQFALQAAGIRSLAAEVELESGPITADERAEADRRIKQARVEARRRSRKR